MLTRPDYMGMRDMLRFLTSAEVLLMKIGSDLHHDFCDSRRLARALPKVSVE